MSKPVKRVRKRSQIAREALEACRSDIPHFYLKPLEDAIEGVSKLEAGMSRELGNPPTAKERREHATQDQAG